MSSVRSLACPGVLPSCLLELERAPCATLSMPPRRSRAAAKAPDASSSTPSARDTPSATASSASMAASNGATRRAQCPMTADEQLRPGLGRGRSMAALPATSRLASRRRSRRRRAWRTCAIASAGRWRSALGSSAAGNSSSASVRRSVGINKDATSSAVRVVGTTGPGAADVSARPQRASSR